MSKGYYLRSAALAIRKSPNEGRSSPIFLRSLATNIQEYPQARCSPNFQPSSTQAELHIQKEAKVVKRLTFESPIISTKILSPKLIHISKSILKGEPKNDGNISSDSFKQKTSRNENPKILITKSESKQNVETQAVNLGTETFLQVPASLPSVDTPNRTSIMNNGVDEQFGKRLIGQGSYGTVFQAIYKGNKVAVKVIPYARRNCRLTLQQEKQALGLCHENVVKILHVIVPEDSNASFGLVIMELVENAITLQYAVDNKLFSKCYTNRYLLDVAHALEFIHGQNILHMDVKPGNVLLSKENRCKLCDFGSCIDIKNLRKHTSSKYFFQQGTVRYIAPEILTDSADASSTCSDIYSLGIVMWFLEYQKEPYYEHKNAANEFILYHVVKNKLRPIESSVTNNKLSALYRKCWEHNPLDRPSISDIISTLRTLL